MDGYKKDSNKGNDEIYSNAVRAGKRTYFFDVRETRGNDHYLTITESKKKYDDQGNFRYEKHKIFLYKEDFEKFGHAFTEAIEMIGQLQNGNTIDEDANKIDSDYIDVDFESLGSND
jgi:hypothetical protein